MFTFELIIKYMYKHIIIVISIWPVCPVFSFLQINANEKELQN